MAITGHLGGTLTLAAQGDNYTLRSFTKLMRWTGATTAGHQLVVKDPYGDILFRSVADGQYFIDMQPIYKWIEGISVETMDSGVLDVVTV